MQSVSPKTVNDLNQAVPKFCLALEKDRRETEGRIRSEREFREHFFPYNESSAKDLLLRFMPREVRGPIIASWGIRGHKAAIRDDDARVLSVVHDAFVAGDIDDHLYEQGLEPAVIVAWADLTDFWSFYRAGKHTKYSIQKALETAYELGLFDARWFFEIIESGGGKLRGTDVLAEGLSKPELTEWVKNIHQSGDGSPKGMLAALGWTTTVGKTANLVLLAVIDAIAEKNGLVKQAPMAVDVVAPLDPGRETHQSPPSGEGDWLENPISMADSNDELDVLIDTTVLSGVGGGELSSSEMSSGKDVSEHERKTDPPFGDDEASIRAEGSSAGSSNDRRRPPPLPDSGPPPPLTRMGRR